MAIGGVSRTEANYRAIYLDSYSSLKDFSMDRRKYFKKYILNEDVEDKDTQASLMGRIVETLLMEPELFDQRFYMSACATPPTGMMLDFVEALYKHTKEATNDEGHVTRSFEDISKDAYTDSGYKIKYEAVISKFVGSDAEIFYEEIRRVRANNLAVVTTQDVANAEKVVEELKTNEVTKYLVNLISSVKYTVMNQFQVEGYIVDGHKFKSMLDKVIINHETKMIYIYDLKCVWAVENFYEEYYLYRRAYIQAYLYYHAMQHLVMTDDKYEGYTVVPPRFIVCDSTNYYNPLIYATDYTSLNDAYEGFEHKGRKYPGVRELVKDLKWALENNVWNISRVNYEANGLIPLK